MKILIIGASGLIGEQLYSNAKKSNHEVDGTYLKNKRNGLYKLDITQGGEVKELLNRIKPDVIIHTAALTNVDYCESNKKETWLMNVEGMINVVKAIKSAKLVYISTDYVFDGLNGPYSEEDIPYPINFYGLTKLLGETITSSYKNHLIIRSTWIYDFSSDTRNFVYRLVKTLKDKKELKVPTDQIANPTMARDLASSIMKLIDKDVNGIINISGSSRMSRYDFAVRIAEYLSLEKELIKGMSSKELNQKARRPKNAGFKLTKAEKILGEKTPSLKESLEKYRRSL